jgi:small acid-soluble spore protein H (minor)
VNINRAQQIVESAKEIEVLYHGDPVWIQNIDEQEQTARVYTADEPDREMDVPVKELRED